ncbi:NACHT, LRR and PYD domains-containing protein 12-like isoform X2 [Engraulis encrasicolus]|uniref:NACHT, LRR and PYD domains-containing protein 12-like isoform X2 n=1 Tax=Engraulis encrasicolus TaxID=184585 RepID=UPI002FCF0FFC
MIWCLHDFFPHFYYAGIRQQRPDSPDPSLASENSKKDGPNFSGQDRPPFRPQRPDSPDPSLASENSKTDGPNFSGQDRPPFREDCKLDSGHSSVYPQPRVSQGVPVNPDVLSEVLMTHKAKMKKRFEFLNEGTDKSQSPTTLNSIYTDLYITEGESECVNFEHEIWLTESACKMYCPPGTTVKINDIFSQLTPEKKSTKTVMTKGIAGIGKTVSVQKFVLDWAEERANQHIDFIFMLPFREMNLIKKEECSLQKLLIRFHPELEILQDEMNFLDRKVIFIFDGLDEMRFNLDFFTDTLTSIDQSSSVGVVLTSLIRGTLLPQVYIWVTSRPAAVRDIPDSHIDLFTEVRGFNDEQKEKYFRKKMKNDTQAEKILTHLKKNMSLNIMCHIPVLCWILSTVFQNMLGRDRKMPNTLTEMFIHFIIAQTKMKNDKYDGHGEINCAKLLQLNKVPILQLAKLAFKNLINGHIMFYEEDLKQYGINDMEGSLACGIFTEIIKEECTFAEKKVYCFLHLTIQEFLAALYVFEAFSARGIADEEVKQFFGTRSSQFRIDLLRGAVDKSLLSENGHLDLFLRFLLGISMKSNLLLLKGLLTCPDTDNRSIKLVITYIKDLERDNLSPDRCMNLVHCLIELDDHSLQREIQELGTSNIQNKTLSPLHCSGMAYAIKMSGQVKEVLDLQTYNATNEGRKRLVPAVKFCKKARLASCQLDDKSYESLARALLSSSLSDLDLSSNEVQQPGLKLLTTGLSNSQSHLECLKLAHCKLTVESCLLVASVLPSSSSSLLRELDLSYNDLQDSGVEKLCWPLRNALCPLHSLRIAACNLTKRSCEAVSKVLMAEESCLGELDMSDNELGDPGVALLLDPLGNSQCHLEKLWLRGCMVTERGCESLVTALKQNCSHLRELDVSYNSLGAFGEELRKWMQEEPNTKLERLIVEPNSEHHLRAGLRKYFCNPTLDSNTLLQSQIELSVREDNRLISAKYLGRSPFCQIMCKEALTGCCYWEGDWAGKVHVGVAYKVKESRTGKLNSHRPCDTAFHSKQEFAAPCTEWNCIHKINISKLGQNEKSWCMVCFNDYYTAKHKNIGTIIPALHFDAQRVGVFLDFPAGSLSFYRVDPDQSLHHLHTFYSNFTEPLYPAVMLESIGSFELTDDIA